jgi:hypothetical protein
MTAHALPRPRLAAPHPRRRFLVASNAAATPASVPTVAVAPAAPRRAGVRVEQLLGYLDTLMQHLDQRLQVFSPHYLPVAGKKSLFLNVSFALGSSYSILSIF